MIFKLGNKITTNQQLYALYKHTHTKKKPRMDKNKGIPGKGK